MTKYLIIILVGFILITLLVLIFTSGSKQEIPNPSTSPARSSQAPQTIPNPSIPPATPLPSDQITIYQSQADKLFADQIKQQSEEYPWLQQLPLQTSDYFVYFETSTNTFTAEIYDGSKEQQLRQEILKRLETLNINIANYKINWQVKNQ